MNEFGTLITGNSLADVWTRYVLHTSEGTIGVDDDQLIREQFEVQINFSASADFETLHPAMDIVRQQQYVRKMLSTEIDTELGGSYGYRIFVSPYGNQFEVALEKLIKRPESKSVTINLLHPLSWERKIEPAIKRTACLTHIQMLVRAEKLYMLAHFRSQNVWNAHGNFKGLRELQCLFHTRLKAQGLVVKLGGLMITIAAAHLYQADFEKAEGMLKY